MRRLAVGFAVLATVMAMSVGPAGAIRPNLELKQASGIPNGFKDPFVGHHWTPGATIVGAECNLNYPTDGLDACQTRVTHVASANGKMTGKVLLLNDEVGSDGGSCPRRCYVVLYEQNEPSRSAREQFAFEP